MKKKILMLAVVLTAAVLNFSFMATPENQAKTILSKMISSINGLKTLVYTMRSSERIVGMKGLRGGDIYTKLSFNSHKVYMKMITDPNKGTEVLYVKGERGDKALVNPGKFLPTVKLNPFSSLLTKDQHHTVLSAGFGFTAKVTSEGMKEAEGKGRFDEVFKYVGDVTWNNRPCYKLVIEDPTWTYTTYKAQKGENMYAVAQKLLIPEYCLVELNGVKNFEEDLGGRSLKVPTSYAKKTVMYIDKENNLPIYQEMHDDRGVFERYEFFNVQANPAFKADEFSEGFSEYNF
jgi:outer membrane lipoprotein-sorting protein